MTSARRAARAARRAAPVVSGPAVPPELLDAGHPVWHNQKRYRAYMDGHGWTMPPAERMGLATAPSNRRQAAAAAWAVAEGVCTTTWGGNPNPHADWTALRRAGLID